MKKANLILNIGIKLNIIFSIVLIASGVYALLRVLFLETTCQGRPEFWCSFTWIGMFIFFAAVISIFCFIIPYISIIYSVRAISDETYKKKAAILGSLTSLVGGLLIMIGKYTDQEGNDEVKIGNTLLVGVIITLELSLSVLCVGILAIGSLINLPIGSWSFGYESFTITGNYFLTLIAMCGVWVYLIAMPIYCIGRAITLLMSTNEQKEWGAVVILTQVISNAFKHRKRHN